MIIYGKNVIKEAIFANRRIDKLLIDEKFNDRNFLSFLNDKKINFEYTNKGLLNELSLNQNHQGVLAYAKDYEYYEIEDVIDKNKKQRFLILDELTDPHNLGAIMRTAEAVSLDAIIISKKGNVTLNATVAKVSSGAIEHVKVCMVTNISQTIEKIKKLGVFVIGTDGSAKYDYKEMPNDISLAIVMGSEGEGIRPLIKKSCDMLVKIPMTGKINSLNVSVAAALIMYRAACM